MPGSVMTLGRMRCSRSIMKSTIIAAEKIRPDHEQQRRTEEPRAQREDAAAVASSTSGYFTGSVSGSRRSGRRATASSRPGCSPTRRIWRPHAGSASDPRRRSRAAAGGGCRRSGTSPRAVRGRRRARSNDSDRSIRGAPGRRAAAAREWRRFVGQRMSTCDGGRRLRRPAGIDDEGPLLGIAGMRGAIPARHSGSKP